MEKDRSFISGLVLKDVIVDPIDLEQEVAEKDSDHFTLGVILPAMDNLTKRQKDILMKKFGFETDRPMTNKAIGAIYGISHERVSQITRRSLEILKISLSEVELESARTRSEYEARLWRRIQAVNNLSLNPQFRR